MKPSRICTRLGNRPPGGRSSAEAKAASSIPNDINDCATSPNGGARNIPPWLQKAEKFSPPARGAITLFRTVDRLTKNELANKRFRHLEVNSYHSPGRLSRKPELLHNDDAGQGFLNIALQVLGQPSLAAPSPGGHRGPPHHQATASLPRSGPVGPGRSGPGCY